MKIDIDVFELVTADEMKCAALDAIRDAVAKQFSGSEENLNRLITNLSYSVVFEMVNKAFDGELAELLKQKVVKVINELSAYSVFTKKDAWGKEDSVAYKALQEEMTEARPLIKARVERIVSDYPFFELERDEIGSVVYECIMDRLFPKNEVPK